MRKGRIEYSVYILDSTADRNFCEAQAHARDVRTQDESFVYLTNSIRILSKDPKRGVRVRRLIA
jgi:hypothetical protein